MIEVETKDVSEALAPERIARGEIILRLITRTSAHPLLVGFAYAFGFSIIRLLVAWRAGHLFTSGTITGMVNDPAQYTNLVSTTIIVAYYAWLPRGISRSFKALHDNRVIGECKPHVRKLKGEGYSYHVFAEELSTSFNKWWWSAVTLVAVSLVVLLLNLPSYLDLRNRVAWAADPVSLTMSLFWAGIAQYTGVVQGTYVVLFWVWLVRLFKRFEIRIRPLHPDGAGGLSPLGDFTLTMSYLIVTLGIILVLTPVTRNYVATGGGLQFRITLDVVVAGVTYALLAPIIFFGPLSVAHRAMRDAKERLLLNVAQRFETEYDKVQASLDSDSIDFDDSLRALDGLQTLHSTTSDFPVWPFNISNLRRFGTSYISPLLLAILIEVLGRAISF